VRDLLIVAAVYASLPVTLFSPYAGLLVYSWLAYMRPQSLAWGLSRVTPLSAWVAIAMLLGIVFAMGREKLVAWRTQTVLLLLLGLWISLTAWTAVSRDDAAIVYGFYWKAILISLVTTGLVRDHVRLRWLLLVISLSIGILGAKSGLYGLLRGGARFDQGPGGLMADNNTFALGLNMTVPLLVGILLAERSKILRVIAAAMTFLCVLTILFTFSRGGLLTLCAVGALLIWRSHRRLAATGVLLLGILGFFLFSSPQLRSDYYARVQSIGSYEEDNSAQGRLQAWRDSLQVFRAHPLLGVGPNNLETVFPTYSDGVHRFHVTHNAYLELLAECGGPSLVLFLLLLGATLYRLERLRRFPAAPWVAIYAGMLQISIVAYMTGSLFLNMAYFDLIYHLVGVSVSLELAAAAHLAVIEASAATPVAAAGEADPWWRRPRPAGGAFPLPAGDRTIARIARVRGL
jgi:probable O-glycosylation ligase (exosortase A-associated)